MSESDLIAMAGVGIVVFFLLYLVGSLLLFILPMWKVYSRAGYSGALALLQLIPLVNVIMLYVLAFNEWPVEQENRNLKLYVAQLQRQQGMPPQPPTWNQQ